MQSFQIKCLHWYQDSQHLGKAKHHCERWLQIAQTNLESPLAKLTIISLAHKTSCWCFNLIQEPLLHTGVIGPLWTTQNSFAYASLDHLSSLLLAY